MPAPNDVSAVRRVLGCFSYYKRFVPKFAELADPLIELTRKNVTFEWNSKHANAFQQLKEALAQASTLALYNNEDPIMLKTDASYKGIAGMLLQQHKGEYRLIACCSRRLNNCESNYGPTDLEGLAVIYAVTKFRPYLLGRHFSLVVDHCSLCVLKSKMPTSPRLRRWALILSEYDFQVIYTKGTKHADVDCLSRAPVSDELDNFFEGCILYTTMPVDTDEWISAYDNAEAT